MHIKLRDAMRTKFYVIGVSAALGLCDITGVKRVPLKSSRGNMKSQTFEVLLITYEFYTLIGYVNVMLDK